MDNIKIDVRAFQCVVYVIIVKNFLKILYDTRSNYRKAIKQIMNFKRGTWLSYATKMLKNKMILFFIMVILISFTYTYFIFIFCNIFRLSENGWLIYTGVCIVLYILIEFFVALIYSIIRYYKIRKKQK